MGTPQRKWRGEKNKDVYWFRKYMGEAASFYSTGENEFVYGAL